MSTKKNVFYTDEHSVNEMKCHVGNVEDMDDLIRALGIYLRGAIETAEGDFTCTIGFRQMTDEEVAALPES